jgi:predicted oxidoreductase
MQRYRADVVIAGGGIAGIVAAIDLLSRGRSVILLDRDAEENFGGLAKESFGGILLVDTPMQRRQGVKDSPELALSDWLSFGAFGPDEGARDFPRRWAEAYIANTGPDIHDYLKGFGIGFLPMPLWVERGLYGEGNSVPRWHVVWGTGHVLATRLIEVLRGHANSDKLTLKFGHRVERIETAAGRATGVSGVTEESGAAFRAEGDCVVVAAGGINGDIARVKANWHADWGRPPETILNGSHKYADGLVHDAAVAHGARLTHLDRMWNYAAGVRHWRPRKPGHGLSLVPPRSALWLDRSGARIGPMPLVSGFDTRDLVTQICAREGGYSWQVLNRKIALKELAVSGAEFNPHVRNRNFPGFLRDTLFGNHWLYGELTKNCPDIVVADTLPELVDKMNGLQGDDAVRLATISAEIARYDAGIDRGPATHNDEQLRRIAHLRRWKADRLRVCKFQKIIDKGAGPLMAIREFIISRKSLGGIRTNLSSRVVDGVDQPLPGLYAIGEAAGFGGGGMNGLRGLEGTFLGGCIYSARRAARAIGTGA